MADIVDRKTRSWMMSRIRGKDTKPEILIRKALHSKGFRYRLHDKRVPGKPDMVFPKYRAAVFIHGCFWHGHDCNLFRLPASNTEFWQKKIQGNVARDIRIRHKLQMGGWRVLTVWECAIRGKAKIGLTCVVETVARWLISDQESDEIRGTEERESPL